MNDIGVRSLVRLEEGWLTFVFLAVSVLSSVWSVEHAGWVQNINILSFVSILALACGLICSRLRWPEWLLHTGALLIGVAVVLSFVANGLPGYGLVTFEVKFRFLVGTIFQWAKAVSSGDVGTGEVIFLLLLALTAWLVGYLGAWTVFREHGAWWPILCSGCALVVNNSYAPTPWWYFGIYLLSSLLLLARVNLFRQQQIWKRLGIRYSGSLGRRLVNTALLVSVLAIGLSWMAPIVPFNQPVGEGLAIAQQPWEDAQIQFNRLFGGVHSRNDNSVSGFGGSLTPRGSFKLADTVVMYVTADRPLYWRVVAYERYTGNGWLTSDRTQTVYYGAGDPSLGKLLEEASQRREEVRQRFLIVVARGRLLPAAAEPKELSVPVSADLSTQEGGTAGARSEVVSLRSGVGVRPGLEYSVVSSVPIIQESVLRQAGNDYPTWVEPYRRLPPSVPPRVRDLAQSVTQGYSNSYDKALALERFIRQFPYTQDTEPPPPGRDWVDYFLFDLREGYCDYFASAMAVMLREIGVPARVVSGYTTGDFDSSTGRYAVRDSHAHSWVEAYFPHYGWIPFEPSGYRPLPARQDTPQPIAWPTPAASPDQMERPASGRDSVLVPPVHPSVGSSEPSGSSLSSIALPLGAGLGLLAAASLSTWLAWNRGLRGMAAPELAYARLSRLARLLGYGPGPVQTPYEYGERLVPLVPNREGRLQAIVAAFVSYRFGRKQFTSEDAERLDHHWQAIRGRMLLTRLLRIVQRRLTRA